MRILIVDDDLAVLRCLERTLGRYHHVTTAQSADAALIFMMKRHFDAVLVDVNMPGMRGDELLAKLTPSRASRVVLMSGGDAPASQRVLQKPFPLDGLLAALDEAAA